MQCSNTDQNRGQGLRIGGYSCNHVHGSTLKTSWNHKQSLRKLPRKVDAWIACSLTDPSAIECRVPVARNANSGAYWYGKHRVRSAPPFPRRGGGNPVPQLKVKLELRRCATWQEETYSVHILAYARRSRCASQRIRSSWCSIGKCACHK